MSDPRGDCDAYPKYEEENGMGGCLSSSGLTIREYMATHILAGLVAGPYHRDSDARQARALMAVLHADALLLALEIAPRRGEDRT